MVCGCDAFINQENFDLQETDPLLAKVMVHSSSRESAIEILGVLSSSILRGPPTNMDFVQDIIQSPGISFSNLKTLC